MALVSFFSILIHLILSKQWVQNKIVSQLQKNRSIEILSGKIPPEEDEREEDEEEEDQWSEATHTDTDSQGDLFQASDDEAVDQNAEDDLVPIYPSLSQYVPSIQRDWSHPEGSIADRATKSKSEIPVIIDLDDFPDDLDDRDNCALPDSAFETSP